MGWLFRLADLADDPRRQRRYLALGHVGEEGPSRHGAGAEGTVAQQHTGLQVVVGDFRIDPGITGHESQDIAPQLAQVAEVRDLHRHHYPRPRQRPALAPVSYGDGVSMADGQHTTKAVGNSLKKIRKAS